MMIDMAQRKRFEALIRARAGLNMREQEAPALQKVLCARCAALHMASPEIYLDLIESDSPAAALEWKQLWMLLTNQESYFFRDAEQLSVLSNHILPALARFNRETRTLRIWSAGCSTGEEPYSLAMMLDEIPAFADWRITLVGTDISEAALSRARRGIYGNWSFRALDEARRARFFTPHGKDWEIVPRLRHKVTWALNNLFGDEFPSREGELHDLDLIVCRNVFIYFDRSAVAEVLKKFGATLRPGGFLVCGHAELHDVLPDAFLARPYPQSVIYERANAPQSETKNPVSPRVAPTGQNFSPHTIQSALSPTRPATQTAPLPLRNFAEPLRPTASYTSTATATVPATATATVPATVPFAATARDFPRSEAPQRSAVLAPLPLATHGPVSAATQAGAAEVLERARAQIRGGSAALGLELVESLLEREPEFLAGWCFLAQAQADAGRLDAAQRGCERALELSPMAPLPYLLQARIAEERGAVEAAKVLLKKVVYLNPRSVEAPLELSAIYQREGDLNRATQMRRAALELLDALNDEADVPTEEHSLETPLRVAELKRQLRAQLEAGSITAARQSVS